MGCITFSARMYHVEKNEYIGGVETYNIGYFSGDTGVFRNPDTIVNNLDYTQFDFGGAITHNIAWAFLLESNAIFARDQVYPTLRLCINPNSVNDHYFEYAYNVSRYNIVACPTSSTRTSLTNMAFGYQYTAGTGEYPLAWATVRTVEELNPLGPVDLVQFGTIWSQGTTHGIMGLGYTLLGNQNAILAQSGDYLGLAHGRTSASYFKENSGAAAFCGYLQPQQSTAQPIRYVGYVGICPTRERGSAPSKSAYYRSGNLSDITRNIIVDGFSWDLCWGLAVDGAANLAENYLQTSLPQIEIPWPWDPQSCAENVVSALNLRAVDYREPVYFTLKFQAPPPGPDPEPPSDVDPTDIPPEDDPPVPIPPDDQDPYYDPTSDPRDPTYDPTKDPKDPTYDPTTPHTPYRPPSDVDGGGLAPVQPIPGIIDIPTAPPAFVTNNSLFTLYNPSGGDLNNLANFLWSPTWSLDTLKKIFVNPMDCILGLMVMPQLPADVSSKEMNFGNVPTGITMHFFTKQFCDFDCGTFKLEEFYMSYLDYAPYTKVSIFLPYIGEVELSTDEVMNKTIGVKYRFDISCGACVAFISVDGSTLYSFSGNCAAHLPLSANDWGSTVTALAAVPLGAAKIGAMIGGGPIGALGAAAAISVMSMKEKVTHAGTLKGSAGLMGIQTPYLIVNRPRQAAPLNQNAYTGYPSFITESLGSLHGYTEVEQCHLDHVPATHEELVEIERLLKEGVML